MTDEATKNIPPSIEESAQKIITTSRLAWPDDYSAEMGISSGVSHADELATISPKTTIASGSVAKPDGRDDFDLDFGVVR